MFEIEYNHSQKRNIMEHKGREAGARLCHFCVFIKWHQPNKVLRKFDLNSHLRIQTPDDS